MAKLTTSRYVRLCILGVCGIVSVSLALRAAGAHHASIVLSHYFNGRAGTCDLKHSFEGEEISRTQTATVQELSAVSRVVESDGLYQKWSTPLGDYWMPKASGNALIYDLSEQKRSIYGNRIRKGDVVLDCGANVGVFARKALGAGAAKVIAIEPAPENLECLRRNFSPEIASGRVVIYSKGVWNQEEVLKFAVDPNDSAKDSFVRAINSPNFISVPVTTIDKMVVELDLPRVDFIKMDIEGSEQKAIAGAEQTIKRFHPRMALCIYHLQEDPVMVPKLVRAMVPTYGFEQTCLCALDRVQPEVAFFY
jgi:FkbM family methyltransferase